MMTLPPIALADLPERTKDFILAFCNQHHCTPEEAMKQTLDLAAKRAGFTSTTEALAATLVMKA